MKKDGYHASHLLFIFIVLPLLKIKTIGGFCEKHWEHWSTSKKDTFYRFKQNTTYRWRTFMYKLNSGIFQRLQFDKTPQEERYFVIDDTILQKLGKRIENVSFIFDHNLGRSVLGFCIVTLGLFTANGFYPMDFAYRFSKKRHLKTPAQKATDPRSISGQMSFEARNCTKLELALRMIKRAVDRGVVPGYVLFDSWYAWPAFINGIRRLNKTIHVFCRLKESDVKYDYKGRKYQLSELYAKVKTNLKKDLRTGLLLRRVRVSLPDSNDEAVIVFSRGYREPDIDATKGKKKKKEPRWSAFLSTNPSLHSSTIIKKYIKRWPIEVCFKECKQLLDLGKDQSNDFNAQVFSTTVSFLRYNLLSFLNETENHATMGTLFESLVDDSVVISYAHRLWDFFQGLFRVCFSKIFDLFEIDDDFHSYVDALTEVLSASTPIQGCET